MSDQPNPTPDTTTPVKSDEEIAAEIKAADEKTAEHKPESAS